MRVAFIGTRGVPATFGGIEHHVEEVGSRLAERGHDVTVYCRANYVPDGQTEYRGMRLIRLPTVSSMRPLCKIRALKRQAEKAVLVHTLGPLSARVASYWARAAPRRTESAQLSQ